MNAKIARKWWGNGLVAVAAGVVLSACATTVVVPATPPAASQAPLPTLVEASSAQGEDDDLSNLIATLRTDLNRYKSREAARQPAAPSQPKVSEKARDQEFAERAKALFAPLNVTLHMPVVGVRPNDLNDSWGEPRDGGRRSHRGIDIFARHGTAVVAVANGIITYIGDQPKAGNCLWLTDENGTSYFYAHLDRWAPGIYEGMEVNRGELLGFVGNTGNAKRTPAHLHFSINRNDEAVNPYPVLARAVPVAQAQAHRELSGGFGTR